MQINDAHGKMLSEMMYFAFLELRQLGWDRKSKQAADLADAFHNIPRGMWDKDFNLELFRDAFLKVYQGKYPKERVRDYIAMVNEMLAAGEDYQTN